MPKDNNLYDVKNAKKTFCRILDDYNSGESEKIKKAKEDAIEFLTGLSCSIAKNYFFEYFPAHKAELLQEGAVGILKGLSKYKTELGAPSTFFYWYIKHEMQNYVDNNILTTSEYYSVNIKKVKAAISRIKKVKQKYTVDDIANDTHLSVKTIAHVLKIMYYENNIHYEGCEQIVKNEISKAYYVDVEATILDRERKQIINTVLNETLNDTELLIIKNLIGMNSQGNKLKYSEIGKMLGFSPAKVKRISLVAIEKLRSSELYGLFDYNNL